MIAERMTDREFWRRHLHEGRYPKLVLTPAEDSVALAVIRDRSEVRPNYHFSMKAHIRERRDIQLGKDKQKHKMKPLLKPKAEKNIPTRKLLEEAEADLEAVAE